MAGVWPILSQSFLWKGISTFCCFAEGKYDLEDKSSYIQKISIDIHASLLGWICEKNPLYNMYFKTGGRKAILPMDLKYAH